MTNQTPNSEIAEILAVFDDIAYRPNSYDFDKAATQLQQLIDSAVLAELKKLQLEGGHIPDEQCCGLCDRIEELSKEGL